MLSIDRTGHLLSCPNLFMSEKNFLHEQNAFSLFFRVIDGIKSAALLRAQICQKKIARVHHIAVALEHTPFRVALMQDDLLVAGGKKSFVEPFLIGRKAFALVRAGHARDDAQRQFLSERKQDLAAEHIKPHRHAAKKGIRSLFRKLSQSFFQCRAGQIFPDGAVSRQCTFHSGALLSFPLPRG